MGPLFDICQQDDLSLDGRQRRQGREEPRSQVGSLEVGDRCLRPVGGERFVERLDTAPSLAAEPVERSAVDDREQPGGKSFRVPAGGELLVRVHERLLRDVLGVSGVGEDGEGARERGTAVSPHQPRERGLLSRQGAVNQLFVGRLGRHVGNRTPAGDEA